jgi:hypothetical protein
MFAVMDENTGGGVPQFATAEYGGSDVAKSCKACGRPLSGSYYQVNGAQVCPSCTEKIKSQVPADSHAAFVRGVLFGTGGALAGLALYVGFAIGTGWVIGFISLAVGFIVGKAMLFGTGGVRGRRYQIAAVILTYSAVSLSAVPIYLSHQVEHPIGVLVLLGLASPFLSLADPMHGLIGLVILFVGIRIAWQLTAAKKVNIVGPLDAGAAATI